MSASFFSSLTGWVYQPNRKKCSVPPGSAAFLGTSQSTITTNPAGTLPFSSPTYSFVNSSGKNSTGRPICEFSAVNYFKNSEFTCCSSDKARGDSFKLKDSRYSLDVGKKLKLQLLLSLFWSPLHRYPGRILLFYRKSTLAVK